MAMYASKTCLATCLIAVYFIGRLTTGNRKGITGRISDGGHMRTVNFLAGKYVETYSDQCLIMLMTSTYMYLTLKVPL